MEAPCCPRRRPFRARRTLRRMARPLGGGRLRFASAVPARHYRRVANAGLRFISAAGTPRPELARCPDGASLRSLVVDGLWGRAGDPPASLHEGWANGAASGRIRHPRKLARAERAPCSSRPRSASGRRGAAAPTPTQSPRPQLARTESRTTRRPREHPRYPAPTRREFGARCACRRNQAQARIRDATRAPRGHARRDARSTAAPWPSHSPEGAPCRERPTKRTARRNQRATSGRPSRLAPVGWVWMGSAASP